MVAPIEDDDNLGVRQPTAELTSDVIGYSDSNRVPMPVIDALLPTAEHQYKLLAAARPLVGNSWGPSAIDETKLEDSIETFAIRLKELNDLREHRLIDESEYKARRAGILGEL